MRKILIFSIAMLFVMGSLALADANITSGDNTVILGPKMGPAGITAPTEVIKVYDTDTGTGTSLNLAMIWDVAYSDGYHVKRANVNSTSGSAGQFAGVMVSRTSKDSSKYGPTGYMAVRGLVQCKVSGTATVGQRLTLTGATTSGTLSTTTSVRLSGDIGTCLKTGTDTITAIWLN